MSEHVKLKAGRPSKEKKAATLTSVAGKRPQARVNFDMDRDEYRKLRIYAIEQGKSVADIFREFVERLNNDSIAHMSK